MSIVILVVALGVAAYLAFSPELRGSGEWSATLTPLASIMGSGFLVSAPLLAGRVGIFALPAMIGLLTIAYLVGGAIRFNIRHFEPIEDDEGPAQTLALISRFVLAAAYFVSVSYYLQLLGAFALSALGKSDPFVANVIASALLVIIGVVGAWRGLQELELIERYAVSLNLGAIASLLVALAIHNARLALDGSWQLPSVDSTVDTEAIRVLLGLLIVVQGFETSRYLGQEHSPDRRVRTMRRAQLISAGIYVLFIGLATVLFEDGLGADVTAIIRMTAPVAVVLPTLLTIAAIGSQFSAAVADSAGSGGLIGDLSGGRLSVRHAYLATLVVTLSLTWGTDVNEIIAWASRAFGLYYCLQALVAATVAFHREDDAGRLARTAGFGIIALVGLLVAVVGIPSE